MKIRKFKLNEAEEQSAIADDTKSKDKKTPALNSFGKDLSKLAEDGKLDPVVGRSEEIRQVAWILSRKKKNNPVLIGEPGTGKTAIIEGLAQLIYTKKCPLSLRDKRIISIEMGSLIAGAKQKGQFEERVQAIINELEKNPEIVVFIDEIHMIVGGAGGDTDAAGMLKPALARGKVQCIGATTLNEYKQSIEKDGALERRFQKVMVEETTPEQTLEILNNIKKSYEDYHRVTYSDAAIKACVDLANRHIPDRFFPDKAIDLLDEVGAKAHLNDADDTPQDISELEKKIDAVKKEISNNVRDQKFEEAGELRTDQTKLEKELDEKVKSWKKESANLKKIEITSKDVAEVFSIKTKIPVEEFDEEEGAKLLKLGENLKMSIIGQDEAVTKVAKCIKRNKAGLKDPKKPIGVFLFLGKTGVGKTELVKALAKNLFGSADSMFKIDMSEYDAKHNVSRMIGSPPGYVGYGEGGQLTEKVRRKPYCVILLDEIEKAHPDVRNIFLQVFDEGNLTDGQGRKVSFKNTIIVMTSNIGASTIANMREPISGFGKAPKPEDKEEQNKEIMKKELSRSLTPEFLNRIDDIIVFSSLSKENIHKIIDIEIGKLGSRLKRMGYTLNITDSVKDFLLEKGYDEKMGARPLNRAIQTYIEDPLSDEILKKNVKDIINLDYNPDSGLLINNNPIVESVYNVKMFKDFKLRLL